MKTLLVINDNSPEAGRAAEFALMIAQKHLANVLLANNFVKKHSNTRAVFTADIENDYTDENSSAGLVTHLNSLNNMQPVYRPGIEEIDISGMTEGQLAEKVNLGHVWMIIKGMPDILSPVTAGHNLDVHVVLNKVLCPLLLIPAAWRLRVIERLTYIADLRYCRIQVVRYLAEFARPWGSRLSIAHISAKGLPDIAEKYALELFNEEICNNVNYDRLFFNNIKEKDVSKTVDVMINAMHNDMLAMVNHRFHFEEIVGRYITGTLPLQITIPLLIFPY